MTDEEARADLEAKVAELMDEAKERALLRLYRLDRAGSGIVQSHKGRGEHDWLEAKLFLVAFAEDLKFQYMPDPSTRSLHKTVKSYSLLM